MSHELRRIVLAGVTAMLVLAAGCGGGDAASDDLPEASSSSSEATPSPSPSSTLPDGVPTAPPERPDDEKSLEGAQAFGRYVLEVWFYTRMTNDPSAMEELAAGRKCGPCQDLLDHVAEQGEDVVWASEEEYGLRNPRATKIGGNAFAAAWDTKMPDFVRVDASSGKQLSEVRGASGWTQANVDIEWRAGQFDVVAYGWEVD